MRKKNPRQSSEYTMNQWKRCLIEGKHPWVHTSLEVTEASRHTHKLSYFFLMLLHRFCHFLNKETDYKWLKSVTSLHDSCLSSLVQKDEPCQEINVCSYLCSAGLSLCLTLNSFLKVRNSHHKVQLVSSLYFKPLHKTFESHLDCKEIQPVHPKGDQSWVFIGRTDVEAETPILWPPDVKS